MASWRYSIGNACRRAATPPVAVSPAVADSVLLLSRLADDYPDTEASFVWRSDGAYAADIDLNLLAATSSRSDAPTGWADLLLLLAGTPGLPANAPAWGTFHARTALKLYQPIVQDVDVMPDEDVRLTVGLELPTTAGSTATGARVRVVDLSTGLGWNGSAWASGGVVATQSVADAYLDVAVTITASTTRTERTTYRVIIEPVASGAFGSSTYVYASTPALFPEVDLAAIIGHNLPADAVVTVTPSGGTAITLTPGQPSMYTVAAVSQLAQVWRLSIQMPSSGVDQPRPILGELWLGLARTMLAGAPVLPIGVTESSPGQQRIEGARGRLEVMAEDARQLAELDLTFRTVTDAAYQQIRDSLARLTRFGAEAILLLPGAGLSEGAAPLYHGRIEDKVSYSLFIPGPDGYRNFSLPFRESPFATG